jgi:Tol biopolymer transport system component
MGATQPRWSPDGDSVLFLSGFWRGTALKEIDIHSPYAGSVAGVPKGVWQPSFSLDGRSILYSMPTKNPRGGWRVDLWTVPAAGGSPMRLIQHGAYGAYSPDGSTIAYHRTSPQPNAYCGACWWVESGLVFAAADGSDELGQSRGGTVAPPEVFENTLARWSPDGSMVLHTLPTNSGTPAAMVLREWRRARPCDSAQACSRPGSTTTP